MKKKIWKNAAALILAVLLCVTLLPNFSAGVHAVTQNQQNIVDRANWYFGITWVAQETVTGWGSTFVKGNTYRIPYGEPVNSGKYIGFGVTFEQFVSDAAAAGSIFYTGKSSNNSSSAPYYTSDSAAFVSWCWNISRTTTNALGNVSTSYGSVTEARAKSSLQLGDALNRAGSDVVLVTNLIYDGSGAAAQIEITQQVAPQMKRTIYTPRELAQKYGDYTILRYTGNVAAAPEKLPCHGTAESESWIQQAAFDVMVYRDRNTDLPAMNDEQLKEHWLTQGIQQGRPSSTILDLKYYLEQNPDLKNAFGDNYAAAYNHFITSGYREHRKSSVLFDANYYLKQNPGVYEAVGEDYLLHYLQIGMKEGFRASKEYDPDYYWLVRPDVAAAWPDDYVMAARHYAGHGINDKTVAYDNKNPVITNVTVSNVSADGYTVTCKATDNVGVTKVAFPTWTVLNDQDDLISDWANTQLGTKNGDTYTFRVKASDHNNETGYYVTHIYAYDAEGNQISKVMDVVEVVAPTPDPDPEPEPEPEPEPVPDDKIYLVSTSEYKREGNLLINVKPVTPVRSLLRHFKNQTLQVLDPNGKQITEFDQVATGSVVELYVDGKLIDSLTVAVRGDLDGNSKVDTTDYMRIKAFFYNEINLSAAQEAAADVDGNGTVDTTDYMRVKAHFLGNFNLNT